MKAITNSRQFVRNYPPDPKKEPDRFAVLSGNNNYRSGKIVSFEQLKMLKKKYGIKRIVNLAKDSMSDQQDDRFNCGGHGDNSCEPKWAKELGLEYFPSYIGSSPPSPERWEKIKSMLIQGDTLIHCTHGVDRTGSVGGAWRKLIEPELSDDQVLDYTYSFGGQWRMAGDPNHKLRDFIIDTKHDPAIRKKVDFAMTKHLYVIGGILVVMLGSAAYYRIKVR